jgi:hypothetical protein
LLDPAKVFRIKRSDIARRVLPSISPSPSCIEHKHKDDDDDDNDEDDEDDDDEDDDDDDNNIDRVPVSQCA